MFKMHGGLSTTDMARAVTDAMLLQEVTENYPLWPRRKYVRLNDHRSKRRDKTLVDDGGREPIHLW